MKEYIKWLEDSLEGAIEEIQDVYESEGLESRWANSLQRKFNEKKEEFRSKH